MTASGVSAVPRPLPRARALARRSAAAVARLRSDPPPEERSLLLLSLLAAGVALLGARLGMDWVPVGFHVLPLLGGSLLLGRRAMRRLLVVVGLLLAAEVALAGLDDVRPGSVLVVVLTGAVAYELAGSREATGMSGLRGESVLVELRARLEQQGALPPLPPGWQVEAVISPAGGAPFAGDFVVSALTGADRLEVALVDVSGKGVSAGTRALLLSGAMGGLLGARSPHDLLPAANAYLERQEWEEGFATAAHLVVDLGSGHYCVESAGHPPVALFDASSGRWSLLEADGPALGLMPDVAFRPAEGRLDPGDALLLYTDGLVEVPGRDLERGTDLLLGEAERLVPRGFDDGARRLLRAVGVTGEDDRGVVIVRRRD